MARMTFGQRLLGIRHIRHRVHVLLKEIDKKYRKFHTSNPIRRGGVDDRARTKDDCAR
jgi:hypothetical protein